MKIVKYLVFLILVISVGGAIYIGTKDGSFDVAESKVINAPAELIYDQVKDYKNWENWGPWIQLDPNIKINYSEKTEGEGASYSWTSEHMQVGNGSMETTKVIPLKEIEQKIIFNTPIGDSQSDVYWRFDPSTTPGQTNVTWGMKGEHTFLEKAFMVLQNEDMETGIGKMFQEGLANLDGLVTEEMKKYSINVDGITVYDGGFYIYNSTASKKNEIGDKMAAMLGQVSGYLQENNIAKTGMPFTIYNQIDDLTGNVIFSACIPIEERVITEAGSPVLCGYMEPITALKTTLKGNYEHLEEAYTKAMEYLVSNKIVMHPTAKTFEVYSTDRDMVPNPADWITEIYIPVVSNEKPIDL